MPSTEIPKINNRIVCIVDRDAKELAAVISSYLFEAGTYIPLFLFGRAQVPRAEDATFMSEGYVAYLMVEHTSVLIHNALVRMGGCEYVVLAGLTEAQKTYLHFAKSQKIIEITNTSEIGSKLESLVPRRVSTTLRQVLTKLSEFSVFTKKVCARMAQGRRSPTRSTHSISGFALLQSHFLFPKCIAGGI